MDHRNNMRRKILEDRPPPNFPRISTAPGRVGEFLVSQPSLAPTAEQRETPMPAQAAPAGPAQPSVAAPAPARPPAPPGQSAPPPAAAAEAGSAARHVSPPQVAPPAGVRQDEAGDEPGPARRSTPSTDSPGSAVSRQGSDVSKSSRLSNQLAPADTSAPERRRVLKNPSATGQPVQLSVNCVSLSADPLHTIEEYHVDFVPNIESVRLRARILRCEEAAGVIGDVLHWTGTNLYLPIRLAQRETEFATRHPMTGENLRVRLVYVKRPPSFELLPFYNSLMHKIMNKLKYVIIHRQHYSPMHKIPIPQYKMEVWPGWVTSVQELDGGLKLIVDSSFRVLRLETVRDILMDIRQRRPATNLVAAFEQELVGTIVMTRYNNKAYRVDGIDVTKKPSSTFRMSRQSDREITYVDYMREHWGVQVKDVHQPMILHKPKPKFGEVEAPDVYLIPELCFSTGITDQMRNNFNIMRAIADHTRLPPDVRESKLIELLKDIVSNQESRKILDDWHLSVSTSPDVLGGRRLPAESVELGEGRLFPVPENADFTRPVTTSRAFKSVNIEAWVMIFTDKDASLAEDFWVCVRELARTLGMVLSQPRVVRLTNESPMTYVNAVKREVKTTDQMVVLLTPGKSQREDRYSAVKRLLSCEIPVPCQFIRAGNIADERRRRSICQKIIIQILSKVGGQPWTIKVPMKRFMVVGIDVYHDTVDRKKSCVGFVASMNDTTSSWWSKTFFQNSLEEITQKLNTTMISAIQNFHSINGHVPQRIIVYRDGVGDGQLDAVSQIEVVQLLNAIKYYLRDQNPGAEAARVDVSYIVVQKRINTKLALRMPGGRTVNPPPGSFLDHTITHPEYEDFYLVSQHVNQGTVSPTKYVLLCEVGNLKLEHHQRLAYKMTHMYYNWTGTIRVPAPCQYAHKLAYLTGENIRQQASDVLANRLYYL